ncbi:MAG: RIP metalloprotease RseP [Pseudomonadota bacterium]
MTIIYFVIVLGILIFIHELGHFLAAKRAGIKVEEFSLGFGPKLIGFTKGETEYKLCILPFGGYVKMTGEDPDDEETDSSDPRAFCNQSLFKRFRVVVAGPLMNLILAFMIMPVVFMLGRTEPEFLSNPPVIENVRTNSPAVEADVRQGDIIVSVNDKDVATWNDALQFLSLNMGKEANISVDRKGEILTKHLKVMELSGMKGGYTGIEPYLFTENQASIDSVVPKSPAANAGIKEGDLILAINGAPVIDWIEFAEGIQEFKGEEIEFTVERNQEVIKLKIVPEYNEGYKRWLVGVSKDRFANLKTVKKRYPFFEAIKLGAGENIKLISLTFTILKRLLSFNLSIKMVGGPIMIAKASANAAASGFTHFLYFLAFISLQLGIFNLLPIPVLDGGHLFFFGIEAIIRKPVSMKIRMNAMRIGLALLLTLMAVVTFNDINRLWNIKGFIKHLF